MFTQHRIEFPDSTVQLKCLCNCPSDLLFSFQAIAISNCIIKRGLLIVFCCYAFLFRFLSLIPFSPLISFSLLTLQASKWSFHFRLHFLIQNTHQNSLHRKTLRVKLPAIFHRQYTLPLSFDRWYFQAEVWWGGESLLQR